MEQENKDQQIQKLPTYSELQLNPEEAFKFDQLNALLCLPPPKKWVKKHPIVKKKNEQGESVASEYISVEKAEFLMRKIFKRYRREIKAVQLILNSVVVTVRVHFMNPVSGEWDHHDGVGAVGIQMDAGSKMSDIGSFKLSGVQMAVPAAASYAFKDACECLGDLFGANLNRRGAIQFTVTDPPPKKEQPKTSTDDEYPI